ncbi:MULTISPECIES: OmpA family protein [unclassified Olleya]|jgi:chemotaxis protein MotB|uniref:OmpA family protein n=1 Tax=unclassified Olleya TaxID=2615019 RepID=UPI0011A5BE72|nr:OmpA family protein [Olleya sp. Hel_I_94]TVZ48428.1 chemotaxis protein MotB [Olleya sp. Hel_I_94]|tara:strand:+ start:165034 stop:165888 length:855 start_codon:yes stop_codon:yes gene_type:complete
MKKTSIALFALVILSSCVSKKKFVALEQEKGQITSELQKTQVEKEELEAKFAKIEARVNEYNSKINNLTDEVGVLTEENQTKFDAVGNKAVISEKAKVGMRETLSRVSPEVMKYVTTLEDSMNMALSLNLKRFVDTTDLDESDDIAISIEETVVMISISDKMLFNSGSYRISKKADKILKKLADVINSEPSLDVMIEGHTDSRTISTDKVADNWDLSVLRATSVVRKLQKDFGVAPEKLIASGRSSYKPVTDNDTSEGRSRNRRTRILILPNIDKFFALMAQQN